MLGGLSPAGVNVGLRAVRVVEARLVVRVSGRVGEVRARVAADRDEAEAVDLGGTDSELLSQAGLKKLAHCQRSLPASGNDSERREPSGEFLPGRVRPQLELAESLVYY